MSNFEIEFFRMLIFFLVAIVSLLIRLLWVSLWPSVQALTGGVLLYERLWPLIDVPTLVQYVVHVNKLYKFYFPRYTSCMEIDLEPVRSFVENLAEEAGGIRALAAKLGVSHVTIYSAIKGKWPSKKLASTLKLRLLPPSKAVRDEILK
jgi:hypothetical protein